MLVPISGAGRGNSFTASGFARYDAAALLAPYFKVGGQSAGVSKEQEHHPRTPARSAKPICSTDTESGARGGLSVQGDKLEYVDGRKKSAKRGHDGVDTLGDVSKMQGRSRIQNVVYCISSLDDISARDPELARDIQGRLTKDASAGGLYLTKDLEAWARWQEAYREWAAWAAARGFWDYGGMGSGLTRIPSFQRSGARLEDAHQEGQEGTIKLTAHGEDSKGEKGGARRADNLASPNPNPSMTSQCLSPPSGGRYEYAGLPSPSWERWGLVAADLDYMDAVSVDGLLASPRPTSSAAGSPQPQPRGGDGDGYGAGKRDGDRIGQGGPGTAGEEQNHSVMATACLLQQQLYQQHQHYLTQSQLNSIGTRACLSKPFHLGERVTTGAQGSSGPPQEALGLVCQGSRTLAPQGGGPAKEDSPGCRDSGPANKHTEGICFGLGLGNDRALLTLTSAVTGKSPPCNRGGGGTGKEKRGEGMGNTKDAAPPLRKRVRARYQGKGEGRM